MFSNKYRKQNAKFHSKVEIGSVSLHAIEKEMEDIPFCCWVAPPLLLAAS